MGQTNVKNLGIPFEIEGLKPSKEIFLKVLEKVEELNNQEDYEIMKELTSMNEEDKEIVKSEMVTW